MANENSSSRWRTAGIVVLAFVALCFALYFGRELLVPIAFAMMLNASFRPIVRKLEGAGLPASAGAAIVVLGLFAILIGAGFALSGPVESWFADAPARFSAAEQRLSKIRQPMERAMPAGVRKIPMATTSPTTSAVTATRPS